MPEEYLLGNEAVARGLWEAGCRFVSSYPGTPSTEITQTTAQYTELKAEWAVNEKVALEAAWGAAVAGARAFCAQKHVGLNVAADPLFTASYTGVNAGLVVAVADDPGMHSSQNEQDSRHYARAAKLLMLEPSDSEECRVFTKLAFELSEMFDAPVLLRLSTRISHARTRTILEERVELPLRKSQKNPEKFVMMPAMARKRHRIVEERLRAQRAWSETCDLNRMEYFDRKVGVITAGTTHQYAKEAFGTRVSYLKLGCVFPLPEALLRAFCAECGTVYVLEELDDVIEQHCRALGLSVHGKDVFPHAYEGEYSQALLKKCISLEDEIFECSRQETRSDGSLQAQNPECSRQETRSACSSQACSSQAQNPECSPDDERCTRDLDAKKMTPENAMCLPQACSPQAQARAPVLCAGCPHRALFYTLKKQKLYVSGDIGCYTLGALPPLEQMDTCLCMGASVSALHGRNLVRPEEASRCVALLGDSTFLHSGITGLLNCVYNQSASVVVLLDNRTTGMTGHQENPSTGRTLQGTPAPSVNLEALCRAIGVRSVAVVDPCDLKQTQQAISEACALAEPAVVISRRPCVLLKSVQAKPSVSVEEAKCIGCRMCLKIGCPAISFREKKSYIDPLLCAGCSLCAQVCPKQAMISPQERSPT